MISRLFIHTEYSLCYFLSRNWQGMITIGMPSVLESLLITAKHRLINLLLLRWLDLHG
jgi:hypothetical protein